MQYLVHNYAPGIAEIIHCVSAPYLVTTSIRCCPSSLARLLLSKPANPPARGGMMGSDIAPGVNQAVMHGPISDLFKIARTSSHAGLAPAHDPASEIYEEFLDWVFDDERFVHWESGDKNFELRCSGTPGCGKVAAALEPLGRSRDSC